MSRDRTACMLRCRNESRWIYRVLDRALEVASQIIIWDDGSTDNMHDEAVRALGGGSVITTKHGVEVTTSSRGSLYYIFSPFRLHVVRDKEAVNEIRDKNCTWSFAKTSVDFDFMLCLDGDEILSLEAIRNWPQAIEQMQGGIDFLHLPFIYLWDHEDLRRTDGIYGDIAGSNPPYAKLNFPRLFTILRLTEATLFDTCFMWFGTQGSFHCGSIPRQNFRPESGGEPISALVRLPVMHMGYIDEELRQRKYRFYTAIDPGNLVEGEYKHIIGLPDIHAPGPLEFAVWSDT
jgi:hypothetical protein